MPRSPPSAAVKHDRIDKLRDKSGPASQAEWEHALTSVLLDRGPLADIEASATIQEGASLTITFHKKTRDGEVGAQVPRLQT